MASSSNGKICMIWVGMMGKSTEFKRDFRVEVSIPDLIDPPAEYTFTGFLDESGRKIFHSSLRSKEIKEVAQEGQRVLTELTKKGAKVVFLHEIRPAKIQQNEND